MPDPVITPAERLRTAERLRAVVVAVGSRARLSALLGYPSDNSLRQAEQGNTTLPDAVLAWAERYAQFRREHYAKLRRRRAAAEAALAAAEAALVAAEAAEAAWLRDNPPPPRLYQGHAWRRVTRSQRPPCPLVGGDRSLPPPAPLRTGRGE
jgi:predicted NAD/FAD-dependent oxidoreductase